MYFTKIRTEHFIFKRAVIYWRFKICYDTRGAIQTTAIASPLGSVADYFFFFLIDAIETRIVMWWKQKRPNCRGLLQHSIHCKL